MFLIIIVSPTLFLLLTFSSYYILHLLLSSQLQSLPPLLFYSFIFILTSSTSTEQRGINPVRVYQGSLMTSLDMKGAHISVLRILDPTWVTFLDAPTSALAWPTPIIHKGGEDEAFSVPEYDLNLSAREALVGQMYFYQYCC